MKAMSCCFIVADNDVIEELKTSSEKVQIHGLAPVFKKWAALIKEHRRRHGDIRGSRT
jgi:hypothetical protein